MENDVVKNNNEPTPETQNTEIVVDNNSEVRKMLLVDSEVFNTNENGKSLKVGDIIIAVLKDGAKIFGGIYKRNKKMGNVTDIAVRFPSLVSPEYSIHDYFGEISVIDSSEFDKVEEIINHPLQDADYFIYHGESTDDSSPLFVTEKRLSNDIETIMMYGKEFQFKISSNGLKVKISRMTKDYNFVKLEMTFNDVNAFIEDGSFTLIDGAIHFNPDGHESNPVIIKIIK